jgi:hypothetical protein
MAKKNKEEGYGGNYTPGRRYLDMIMGVLMSWTWSVPTSLATVRATSVLPPAATRHAPRATNNGPRGRDAGEVSASASLSFCGLCTPPRLV